MNSIAPQEEFTDDFYKKFISETFEDERGRTICEVTNKLCFETKTQARKLRKHYEIKYGKFFRIYVCEHCNKFHLSSTDSKYKKNT
jgi:hypothetical protein